LPAVNNPGVKSSWLTLPNLLALLMVSAYILRCSVLPVIIPPTDRLLVFASYAGLLLCWFYSVLSFESINLPGLLFVLACLPGAWFSSERHDSLAKYAGWALMMLALAPVLTGKNARQIRRGAWQVMRVLVLAVGIGCFGWWVLRLPMLGRGQSFTGLMSNANMTGPMVSLGVVVAVSAAIASRGRRFYLWSVTGALCVVPAIVAGSRISLAGLLAALLVVFVVQWQQSQRYLMLAIPLGLLLVVGGYRAVLKSEAYNDMTQNLQGKGLQNSREELWPARVAEFKAHPLWGMGVGMGEGAGFEVDEEGHANIEPGSSYLAILSMTGYCGAIGFSILLLWFAGLWLAQTRLLPISQAGELAGVGAFMAVHGIAEGWILGVGSPLCLIFWLWTGYSADVLQPQVADRIKSKFQRKKLKTET
jgi:hypothetical protein